jgi:HD-GYP domain-containing protein (c-di-GMP phosphodiesterase class II)
VAAEPQGSERVRGAELIAALCLATDLGMGFPFEHGLQTTVIAMRLADRLGVDRETASETYHACLLSHAGCTTEAHVAAEVFGGSLTTHLNPRMYGSTRDVLTGLLRSLPDADRPAPVRALQTARRLPRMARESRPALTAGCEVAGMLADQTGAPASVSGLLAHLTERWDGHGPLRRATGEQIPVPMRIVHVATDAALQRHLGGTEHAARLVRERAGHAFDHSAGVAELAGAAAARRGIDGEGAAAIVRAGLVHDLGRVAVHARIWQKPGPLTRDEWEQVRLHPYHTERVLCRSRFLSALAPAAAAHHERLDASGYHRGAVGADLALPARLLAAADAYHAMCEPRPHRAPLSPELAAAELAAEANAGRLDPNAVTAVVEAAGQPAPRVERPAGLTERESEVIGMLARGLQTKQVARALGISPKTADRHIQNAYGKIGVSTRAAATLFAMEHALVAWGELPIARPRGRS